MGVCGSIAAYKATEVVRTLSAHGADVRVVMTESATKFVGPPTFAALSGNEVLTDIWAKPNEVSHVMMGRWAEAFVIVAATASTIERLASGSASDALSATYLMCKAPVILAPAMHTEMWEHAAVQRNVATLIGDGVSVIGPGTGPLASGDFGIGRLSEPADIAEAVITALTKHDLDGVRVLITSGPTREALDPVRYLSNSSTGVMGSALARQALRRGASVTLIQGPGVVAAPSGAQVIEVTNAEQMLDACMDHFKNADVIIKAAAVADMTPVEPGSAKAAKSELDTALKLRHTVDIAAELGKQKGDRMLIVFAAQTENVKDNAIAKLISKNADLVVGNLVGQEGTGFGSDTNDAILIDNDSAQDLERLTKIQLADRILDRVVSRLTKPTT